MKAPYKWDIPKITLSKKNNKMETIPQFITQKNGKLIPVIRRKKGMMETDRCPYCNNTHIHGTLPGHRVAHCASRVDGKKIGLHLDDGTFLENSVGYIILEY
jgi:hypothetical protein